jgi:RNA polymerase sigma factor (sigma-70 family)
MMHQPIDQPMPVLDPVTPSDRRRIAEEATEWLDRLEEGGGEEKALFAEWLKTSPLHIEAFLKACAVERELQKLGKAKSLSKRTQDVVVEHPAVALADADLPEPASNPFAHLTVTYRDYPGLRALILKRVRDPEVAADILQDAAVTTLERLRRGEIAHPENLGGYLYRVAINHLRLHRRRERMVRYAPDTTQLELLTDEAPSPEREFVRSDWTWAATRMLSEVQPVRDRELLIRFYLNDESKEDICRHFRMSSEHFNRVIFRARNRFRELLEKRGFDFDYRHRKPTAKTLVISYDSRDRGRLKEFHAHLASLRQEGVINTWVDREISAGTPTGRDAGTELERASLFVPLVSRELLNSRYCYGMEMTRALTLEESGQVKIAPVILEDCHWRRSPFGRFEPLPADRPVAAWLSSHAAFRAVVCGLHERLEERRAAGCS